MDASGGQMKESGSGAAASTTSSSKSQQLLLQQSSTSFRCQRCCVRLKLDSSLRSLDKDVVQATVDTFRTRQAAMAESTGEDQQQQQQQQQPQQQQQLTMFTSCDSDSNDFLLLDGAPSISQNMSSRLAVFERLFDFLNANCAADHPLCCECADALMQLQKDRVTQLDDELHCMRRYLAHLQQQQQQQQSPQQPESEQEHDEQEEDIEAEVDEESQLAALEAEEAALRAQLEAAGAELAGVRAEADAEEARKTALASEQRQMQHAYSELKRQLFVLDDQLTACRNQQAYAEAELNRLQNTSVLGAAFHIWYDAQLASIGGFRMGRPPGQQIDWAELNAGWGQCALLLQAVSSRLGFVSAAWAVVPCASQSEIRVLSSGRSLPLYSSHGRIFLDSAFDAGMSAYLSCLAELLAFVRQRHGKDRLAPYPVHPPRELEDSGQRYAITRAGNKDERWTMALRLMLLDFKMLLAWMSTEPELLHRPAAAAAAAAAAGSPTGDQPQA